MTLVLATVLTGSVSYVVLFVGSRTLNPVTTSAFVTLWAITNTALLTLTVPADTYAPRFRLECTREEIEDSSRLSLITAYSMAAGFVVALLPLALAALGRPDLDGWDAFAIALFSIASALFASRRAYLTSSGDFRKYLLQTAALSAVGVGGLLIVLLIGRDSQAPLYLALAIGNLVAAIVVSPRRSLSLRRTLSRFRRHLPFLMSVQAGPTLARLVVATMVAVLLTNGALMVARLIGTPPSQVVAYAAAVNLVLIPYTLLNSFTGPIHNRFVEFILRGQISKLRVYYIRTSAYYLIAAAAVSVASYFALEVAIQVYVGSEYYLSGSVCFGIALGEGLATTTELSRALLVALGESRLVTPIWLSGVAAFALVLFLPIDPVGRLVLGPLVAAAVILVFATLRITTDLRKTTRNGHDSI